MLEPKREVVYQEEAGVTLWADYDLMKQLLWIHGENAIKYTHDGGRITVRVWKDTAYPAEHAKCRKSWFSRLSGIFSGNFPYFCVYFIFTIKYTHDGGRITVRVWKDKKYGYVSIADDGVGIGEEDRAKIFDRFYRVDKSRNKEISGTGLGLMNFLLI